MTVDFAPYVVHHLAEAFPLMTGDAWVNFVASIKESGQLAAIAISADGTTLIDGRNRWRACAELGIEPRVVLLEGMDEAAVIGYIADQNLNRRHLTVGERAFVGAKFEAAYAEEAKMRMAEAGRSAAPGRPMEKGAPKTVHLSRDRQNNSANRAAATVGIGVTSILVAKKLLSEAPDLAEEVRTGVKKLGTAHREMKERQSPATSSREPSAKAERVERIREMAARGSSSRQIAETLGYSTAGAVSRIAAESGIEVAADAVVGRSRKVDSMRVARATADQIIACCAGLDLVNFDDIDTAEASTWVTPMRESLKELNRFVKQVAACCEPNMEMTQ